MAETKGNKLRILFLCTSNSARSQMAEAFLRKYAGDKFEAYSAGMEPQEIHPATKQVMEEIGVPLTGQRAKGFREYLGKVHFAYLIILCSEAEDRCPTTFPGMGQRLHWPFPAPATFRGDESQNIAMFRQIRDQIKERITEWIRDK